MDINRKAELFDNALKGIKGLFPNKDLYEILRDVFGMTDDEIKESGIQIADTPLGTISGVTPENGYVPEQPLKLQDLLQFPLPDNTYLEHDINDMGFMPVSHLSDADLSPEMREEWADVLKADVRRIFPGAYGTHIEVGNVDPERLSDFSFAVSTGQAQEQKMSM